MERKTKLVVIFIFIILLNILLIGNFYSIAINDSKKDFQKFEIKQGEEISFTVNLSDIDNINVYKAQISYDERVWKKVDNNNFSLGKNWQSLQYNSQNSNFIMINKEGLIDKNGIFKVKLIARENAPLGTTRVYIENIIVSDGVEEIKKDSIEKEITIKASPTTTTSKKTSTTTKITTTTTKKTTEVIVPVTIPKKDKTSTTTTQSTTKYKTTSKPTTKNTSKRTTTIFSTSTKEVSSSSSVTTQLTKDETAKTPRGKKNVILYIVVAILLIVLIVLYIIINKKGLKVIMLLLLCGLTIGSSIGDVVAKGILLGDLNSNSIIDDGDIELLEKNLIGMDSKPTLDQADMSHDNNITIIDLALLIKQQMINPYDTYNVTGISAWKAMPIVSEELLMKDEVTIGGEGCQWPIGMAMSKDGKLLLIGTDVGGVYRSADGGKTYEQSNAGLNSRGVGAFAIDPNNSSYVIAIGINSGAFDSNGPHISEDGGKTWKMTKSMLIVGHRDIRDSVAYDETSYSQKDNRSMIAYWSTAYKLEENKLTDKEKGLYRTNDGGYTWNLINQELSDGTIKVNPYTGNVYVSKEDGIYYSSNQGENFIKIIDDKVTGFDLIASSGNIFIYYCNEKGVYISDDGIKFTKIKSKNYPTKEPMHIKVSPVDKDKMIIVNKEGDYHNFPYYSLDGGYTWTKSILDDSLSMMPYNNRSSIPLWSPVTNKVWLFVQGDFVSSSVDSGKTFKWDSNGITGILSGGYVHHNVYNPDIIYFGSQDYNGAVTTDGGKTWKYINMSGNRWGGFCYGGYAVDENTFFVGVADSWYGPRELKITFDGGKTVISTGLHFTQENLRASIESSYQSPTDPKVLFAADLRSDDGGRTWKKMNGCINVYTHNPKGKKELYGMDETAQYVVVSYDNGVTWKKVNKEKFQPNKKYDPLKIDDVAYDWKNNALYVAAGWGYLYRVYVDDGRQEYVINRYKEKYNVAPVNQKGSSIITRVAVDPRDPNIIYCGGAGNTYLNNSSLYRSVDGGKSFQVMTSNTTNSIVQDGSQGGFETNSIEVNPKTGEVLFAGGCFGISKLLPPYPIN